MNTITVPLAALTSTLADTPATPARPPNPTGPIRTVPGPQ